MAGVNIVPLPTLEPEGDHAILGHDDTTDTGRRRAHTSNIDTLSEAAASSSSSSSSSDVNRRRASRRSRPDGSSDDAGGPSDLRSLEQALRRESIVDIIEVAPLTVPSTPVRDCIDGISNDVRVNLELASVKLSKLAPED